MTSVAICFNLLGYQKYAGVGIFAAISILFIILMIFIEKRAKDPIIPFKVLRRPTIDYLFANTFVVNSGSIC